MEDKNEVGDEFPELKAKTEEGVTEKESREIEEAKRNPPAEGV